MTRLQPNTALRWNTMTYRDQLLTIGAEFNRLINFATKGSTSAMREAYWRIFELVDLLKNDLRWRHGLKEICRFREMLTKLYVENPADTTQIKLYYRVLLSWKAETYAMVKHLIK